MNIFIFCLNLLSAIGAGAVQANMAVFGAEQSQKSKITVRFFDKYVVAVNIGGIIATLVIPLIGKETGNHYIAAIVVVAMLIFATVLFMIGCRYYIHVEPYDTVMTVCVPVVLNACQSWHRYKTKFIKKEELRDIDKPLLTFLDFAKIPNQGKFLDRVVDNVKSVPGALAICIILIPFWLIYDQVKSSYILYFRLPNDFILFSLMLLFPCKVNKCIHQMGNIWLH
jgi:dipeptide/tripeptide permease